MKYIFIILILTITAFAQNTIYMDGTDCECDSIHRDTHEISGGRLIIDSPYKKGKKNGNEIAWFVENIIVVRITDNPSNDVSHGAFLATRNSPAIMNDYIQEPILVALIPYKNGKKEGKSRRCYTNGVTQKVITYKNNKKHGEEITYTNDGEIKFIKMYTNGKISK